MTANKGFKFSFKSEWPLLLILLASLIYGYYVYPALPERVPSHWNMQGQVNGWSSAFWGAFGIPLLNIGLYVLFFVMPVIDPRRERYAQFKGAYNMFRYAFHILMTGFFLMVILSAQGHHIAIDRWVPMGISILFIVIGNYMGKIRHNYFFGIKTPWTLASEEVWQKTHRMAGPLWVLAGLVSFVASIFGGLVGYITFFSMIAMASLIPAGYAYLTYQKITK